MRSYLLLHYKKDLRHCVWYIAILKGPLSLGKDIINIIMKGPLSLG